MTASMPLPPPGAPEPPRAWCDLDGDGDKPIEAAPTVEPHEEEDRPTSAAEARTRLRDVLVAELGPSASWRRLLEKVDRREYVSREEWQIARVGRSPADVLFLVDELVGAAVCEVLHDPEAPSTP